MIDIQKLNNKADEYNVGKQTNKQMLNKNQREHTNLLIGYETKIKTHGTNLYLSFREFVIINYYYIFS